MIVFRLVTPINIDILMEADFWTDLCSHGMHGKRMFDFFYSEYAFLLQIGLVWFYLLRSWKLPFFHSRRVSIRLLQKKRNLEDVKMTKWNLYCFLYSLYSSLILSWMLNILLFVNNVLHSDFFLISDFSFILENVGLLRVLPANPYII